MGFVKKFERSSKRLLMRALGRFLSVPRYDADWFKNTPFGKILVIRQHNQMGDMLLATPALRAIKESRPEAQLGIVTSTLNRGVLLNNPSLSRVFTYDKRNPLSHLKLILDLRRERYDLVIVLHTVSFSFTSVLLAVLSGARVRSGSASRRIEHDLSGSYFSIVLPLPGEGVLESMNEAEHNLYPLRAIGLDTADISPQMVPSRQSESWAGLMARECWGHGEIKLVVHPGAGKTENVWPPDKFASVVNGLKAAGNVGLAVIEGPRDAPFVTAFNEACDVKGTVVRGRTIGDVAALMVNADLVLCNDTGVMHVAAAAGARTLAVFGPTDPGRWAPRTGCLHIVRAPRGRLAELEPGQVLEKAADILGLVLGT